MNRMFILFFFLLTMSVFAKGREETEEIRLPDKVENYLFDVSTKKEYIEGQLPQLQKLFFIGITYTYSKNGRITGFEFIDEGSVYTGFGEIKYSDGKIAEVFLYCPMFILDEKGYEDFKSFHYTHRIVIYEHQDTTILIHPWYDKLYIFDPNNNLQIINSLSYAP